MRAAERNRERERERERDIEIYRKKRGQVESRKINIQICKQEAARNHQTLTPS